MTITQEQRVALAKVFEDALMEYINETCLDDITNIAYDLVQNGVDAGTEDDEFVDFINELTGGICVNVK